MVTLVLDWHLAAYLGRYVCVSADPYHLAIGTSYVKLNVASVPYSSSIFLGVLAAAIDRAVQ